MREKGLTRPDAAGAQLRGETAEGDKRAGRRGCGHGPAVSRTPSSDATGLIDQRSFPQVRLGLPK
ncbi:hypothetical protein GCM10017779_48330 [Streptomyces capillispiralis]|nr:hypothetical protein GCM10017779_48330 [Streptomyces capillispiralis]